MKFKVGDIVLIKDWDEMEKEFGLDNWGDIKCRCAFTSAMKGFCGKIAAIYEIYPIGAMRLEFNGEKCTEWDFSEDMIKPYQFTKANLENGMILKTRDGFRGMYIDGNIAGSTSWFSVYDLSEDLKCDGLPECDIMEVYRPRQKGTLKDVMDSNNLIWKRKEPKIKELTTEEAIALLKEKFTDFDEIKIVK